MKANTTEDIELKAVKFINTAFDSFSSRSGLEDKWRFWDKIYNLIPGEKQGYDGFANLFPPETRRAVETLHDFADDVLFGSDPWFRIRGVDGTGDQKKADVYRKVADYQNEKIRARSKFSIALRHLIKRGFVIVKVPYVYKEKMIVSEMKERAKLQKQLKGVLKGDINVEKERKVIFDSIDIKIISPFNLFWNYFLPWEDQTIIIEKIDNVTDTHLRLMEKKGIYKGVQRIFDDRSEAKTTGNSSGGSTVSKTESTDPMDKYPHYDDLTGLSGHFDDGKEKTTLLECWCNFDIDGDGIDEECVITIANGKHVIRMAPNPYDIQEKPYLWCPWEELEDTSLGIGACQIAEKSQLALNDFTNQVMDDITEILDCVRVVDTGMIAEGQNVNSRPRGVVKVTGNPEEAIAFIRPPNVAQVGLQAATSMKEDIRNGTGANVSLQGLAARYDTTATEYKMQGGAAGKGVLSKLRNFEDRIIKPYLTFQYSYNEQYIDRETLIKIVGEDAASSNVPDSTPADVIIGDYDFVPVGVTQIENKIVKGQQLINFLNIAKSLPPGVVDLAKLVHKIWTHLGDGDDSILLPQAQGDSISAEEEDIMLSQGQTVTVHNGDYHDYHIIKHMSVDLIPQFAMIRDKHVQDHLVMKQAMTAPMVGAAMPGMGGHPQGQPMFTPKPPIPGAVPGDPSNPPVGA